MLRIVLFGVVLHVRCDLIVEVYRFCVDMLLVVCAGIGVVGDAVGASAFVGIGSAVAYITYLASEPSQSEPPPSGGSCTGVARLV